MKFKMLALAVLASAVTVAACSSDEPVTTAQLRAVHLSPNAPNVDILVNGAAVASNVAYLGSTSYLSVPSGPATVQVRPTGTSTNVIDETPTLEADEAYTVLAANFVTQIEAIVLVDDRTAPPTGSVRVRIVHGAPTAPAVDVYVTSPTADLATALPVLTNVTFGVASGYLTVPAGTYRIRVTVAGTKNVAIDSGVDGVALSSGQVRTVIATDNTGGGVPFGAIILADLN
jgi:hypothetical protein